VLRQRAEKERRVSEAARRRVQQREARGWAPPHHCALHRVIKPASCVLCPAGLTLPKADASGEPELRDHCQCCI